MVSVPKVQSVQMQTVKNDCRSCRGSLYNIGPLPCLRTVQHQPELSTVHTWYYAICYSSLWRANFFYFPTLWKTSHPVHFLYTICKTAAAWTYKHMRRVSRMALAPIICLQHECTLWIVSKLLTGPYYNFEMLPYFEIISFKPPTCNLLNHFT